MRLIANVLVTSRVGVEAHVLNVNWKCVQFN